MQITGFTAEHHYNNSHVFQMDNMDFMRQIPDKYFDLGVVDPPYGLDERLSNGGGKLKNSPFVLLYKKSSKWDLIPEKIYFDELFRVCKHQIIWGGNYFNLPPTRGIICWDKEQYLHTMSQFELGWTSFDCVSKILKLRSNDLNRFHPTQKPIALYSWIFDNYAKPGWKILDTHLGSQSSRIAAYKKGFEFWATELDPDYFSEGNARFMNAVKMPLFENLPPEQLQMW